MIIDTFMFVVDLQDTTFALDFRLAALEENGGDDELIARVEALEGTAADHETRVYVLEADVSGIVTIFCISIYSLSPRCPRITTLCFYPYQ